MSGIIAAVCRRDIDFADTVEEADRFSEYLDKVVAADRAAPVEPVLEAPETSGRQYDDSFFVAMLDDDNAVAEPVTVPQVAPGGCAACGAEVTDPEATTRLGGTTHKLCFDCYEVRDGEAVDADIRARSLASVAVPVESPEACGGLPDVARAPTDALERFLRGETNGVPKGPTQADRDDAAVRELLSREPATWGELLTSIGDVGGRYDRAQASVYRLGIVNQDSLYSLPEATTPVEPTAATGREDGR